MQTILIVDDDRTMTEALAGGLEQPGRELERTPPACMITDVLGPGGALQHLSFRCRWSSRRPG